MSSAATIFALSSGSPPAAIGIIRISGPHAGTALQHLAGTVPPPRRATFRPVREPATGEMLDRALLLWFPGPRTATGEDLAELHLHGGRAVIAAVLRALESLPELRPAEAGEFTRRAFDNGVIDLVEAEGLADLLSAETESQRRNAIAMAGGGFSQQVGAWQAAVLTESAKLEASIEFEDEADVVVDHALVRGGVTAICVEMRHALARPSAERLKDGVRIVLAGPPNAGKSTLLNAIIGRDAAIISPLPGTTRDVIEAPVQIGGVPMLLFDTAGLRDAGADEIEEIGIARAKSATTLADVLLWLGEPVDVPAHPRSLLVHARMDQPDRRVVPTGSIPVSASTGEGLTDLIRAVIEQAAQVLPSDGEVALNRRQREVVRACLFDLDAALAEADAVLAAEHLRLARVTLDRLTGGAGVEEMLAMLFGRFCIGK